MIPIIHSVIYMGVGIILPVIPAIFVLGVLLCEADAAWVSRRLFAFGELVKPLSLSLCLPLVLATGLVIISHIVQVGVVDLLFPLLYKRIN